MKAISFLFCSFLVSMHCFALHGKGGVLTYEYLGPGTSPNTSKYRIIAKDYFDCHGTQFILTPIYIGIYDGGTKTLYTTLTVQRSSQIEIEKTSFGCITPAPEVCFVIADFITEVDLPNNTGGYVLVEQECCRINGLINIQNSSGSGMTNVNIIPGVINGIVYRTNSSAVFAQKDTSVICYNSFFTLDMSATDKDGDSLAYSFCPAKSSTGTSRQPNPPSPPPYQDLVYQNGFTAAQPLGGQVTIDPKTGIISGIAPSTLGSYVIAVCVYEYKDGVLIGETKKEVQVEVARCSSSVVILKTQYVNCHDYTITFQPERTSNNIAKYEWDFGVDGITTDISNLPTPTFTYSDTGKYTIKLKVQSTTGCEDSTTSIALIYPGFSPGYKFKGSCREDAFEFTDTSTTKYGIVDSWKWNFGDNSTAQFATTSHNYNNTGAYTTQLIVTTSKGCSDTVSKTVSVYQKPVLTLPFRDTLICSVDTLALQANGTGVYSWAPNNFILNSNTSSPLVFPKDTSLYIVTLDNNGCIVKDSIKVNVLDFVTINLLSDTTICRGDSIALLPTSDALHYVWSPINGLINPIDKNQKVAPQVTSSYQVIANVGKCQATASVNIKVVPYPVALAGNDTTICYADSAQLNASVTASSFTWTPNNSLLNSNSLTPTAFSLTTTNYILTVGDTLGCPKKVRDTILVTVLPQIHAFAGSDTLVVVNQPLQLNASGGEEYIWTPATSLSNALIKNPVGKYNGSFESITYVLKVSRTDGCYAYDTMTVKVFKTDADIFVPSGFTPNNDSRNDILRPILVGMKKLERFSVYNRWGQLVFSTNETGKGWDGKIAGLDQKADVYVYIAIGINYMDQKIIRKGTTTLLR